MSPHNIYIILSVLHRLNLLYPLSTLRLNSPTRRAKACGLRFFNFLSSILPCLYSATNTFLPKFTNHFLPTQQILSCLHWSTNLFLPTFINRSFLAYIHQQILSCLHSSTDPFLPTFINRSFLAYIHQQITFINRSFLAYIHQQIFSWLHSPKPYFSPILSSPYLS